MVNKTNITLSDNIILLDNILSKYNINDIINNINLKYENNEDIFDNNDNNDQNKELKNFFTDVVTNHILDETNLFNLLYIINKIYNDVIKQYIIIHKLNHDDILFIFKGGNIFKFIAEKFWSELPNKAMYKFISEYKKYFKRSDLDFGIYINPKLNNSNIIVENITIISYNIQLVINDILINNKNLFFKWFKYSTEQQKLLLNNLLNDLNKLDILNNKSSIYYNNKFTNIDFINISNKYKNQHDKLIKFIMEDIYISNIEDLFNNNNTVSKNIKKSNNVNSFMYNSINKALRINTNKRTLEFNLTRTKINFNLYLKNKINNLNDLCIGGELIDVSIGHDDASVKFYKNKNSYIDTINLKKNNESFNINIYSYKYLYIDLRFILFETVYFPWEDYKYSKRLYRLFYLTFIDLITNIKKHPINNKYIKIIYQYYSLIYNIIIKFKNNDYNKQHIKKISKLLTKSKLKEIINNLECKKECLLLDLLRQINIFIEKVLYPRELIDKSIHNHIYINNKINNKRELHTNEYDNILELLEVVKNNLNNLLIVNTYINNYSSKEILFDYKNIDTSLLI